MEEESKPKDFKFLVLSLYYYLKKNNFSETAEQLFKECELDEIFKFPENMPEAKTEKEKLTQDFISFFYQNSFENSNFDLLSEFWNKFWIIFANKMNVGNNQKIEEGLYNKNEKNLLALTYFQKNFTNLNKIKNLYLQNNSMNDNFNTINNLSNISKKTNNEINSDEMAKIVNSSQENPQF